MLHQTGSGEMAAAATILHLVTPPPGPCSCSGRARQTAVWCFIRGLHDIIISSESRVAWLLSVKLRQVTTGGGAEAGVQLRGARRTRRTAAAGERDTGRHLAGVLYSVRCVQCTVLYMRGSSYTGAGAQLRANSGHNQSISGNTHLVNINSNKCTLVTRSWAVAGDLKMI